MTTPSRSPGPGFDPLSAYRTMFGTARDGVAAYWYFGTAFVEIEGFPVTPAIQAETLMVYKTTTLSPDAFRMDWWEIGYMRDIATGEISKSWVNPITGAVRTSPQKFEEGPAHFLIQRDGDGLKLELEQAHARIDRVDVVFTEEDGRILLTQTERKTRGFPLPDGTMVGPDHPDASAAVTTLSIISSRPDLASDSAPGSGAYDFVLQKLPSWMGFGDRKGTLLTRGAMVKAEMNHALNPIAWQRLKDLFPECFDGDVVLPKWPEPAA
ncbi:hypothetical protein [Brevundimonas sp.]|uniref:hypothetical protein n=1 Tax=Brevundimonas sp. TaxID=1871086 RepID=UPI003D0F675C